MLDLSKSEPGGTVKISVSQEIIPCPYPQPTENTYYHGYYYLLRNGQMICTHE